MMMSRTKRFLAIALAWLMVGASCAAQAQTPGELAQEAMAHYTQGDFALAAEAYHGILRQGLSSAPLHYNLANCYFRLDSLSLAILHYEKALLLAPGDEDILHNLEQAQAMTIDQLEVIEPFFLRQWYEWLASWAMPGSWAFWSSLFFVLTLALFVAILLSGRAIFRKAAFFSALTLFLFSMASLVFAIERHGQINGQGTAIVFEGKVQVKSSPEPSGKVLFEIHEGTKVELLDSLGQWCEIRLSDGELGWLPLSSIRKI